MTFGRRLQIALFLPFFILIVGIVFVAVALDRWLRLPHPFPRDTRALARRRAWCLDTLTRAGALPKDAHILGFEVLPFKSGEAFRSSVARVVVDHEVAGVRHRFEALAKFAPAGGSIANRVIFVFQRVHLNEVGFYGKIVSAGDFPVPRAYYSRAAQMTGNFCLLLERVPDVIEHTEEAGCPLDAARSALTTLAQFHARHWGRTADFPPKVTPFTIDFACSLALGRRNRVLRHLARTSWHQGNTPQTLIHGDARVGNMLFSAGLFDKSKGDVPPVTLIDWQALRWGRAAFDLNYFLLLSLESETRASHEDALIAHYHQALCAAGVTDYSLEDLRDDSRHVLVLVFSLLVIPFLGGEITLDSDNSGRALSGALVWLERLRHATRSVDSAWLSKHYGLDADAFREVFEYSTKHPPILNRGAIMVARHLEARARAEAPSKEGP